MTDADSKRLPAQNSTFVRRTKEAASCNSGSMRWKYHYHSEYGNSWFNNMENDDAYHMFRPYNNCYYSASEPITDEEDES